MFGKKNKVQLEYKKQIKEYEKEMKEKQKNGDGAFSNASGQDNFYGRSPIKKKRFSLDFIPLNRIAYIIIISIIAIAVHLSNGTYGSKSTLNSNSFINAYNNGQYQKTVEYCDKKLNTDSTNFQALYYKGRALNDLKKYSDAVETLKKAEGLKLGDKEDVYLELGYAHNGLGEYKESLDYYDKAFQLNPQSTEALSWKAYNQVKLKNYETALDLCDESLNIDSKVPFTYDVKGLAYYYLEKDDEALKVFDDGIKVDSKYKKLYIDKAFVLFSDKNYSDCINLCVKSQKLFPKESEFPYFLGDCYSEQNISDKAIEAYSAAAKLDPDNYTLISTLGWEYLYAEDLENASKNADKALALKKDYEDAVSLKDAIEEEKLPEGERIVKFVKDNYLYLDKVANFEEKSKNFTSKTNLTDKDIADFIDSIKLKDDRFTFTIYNEDYDDYQEEENSKNVASNKFGTNSVYVKISSFSPNVDNDFKKTIDKISDTENKNLIIDLRDDTGGLAKACNNILDILLPECTTYNIADRNGKIKSYTSGADQVKFNKIVILVNGMTASCSELLTLSLKTYLNNVTVIGQPTVGKGVGQVTYENKSKKYSIFLVNFYWDVQGKNILGDRIHPDILVSGKSDAAFKDVINGVLK